MKVFRSIEIEKCAVCGGEFDKVHMFKIFTGRTKYICPDCYQLGNSKVEALHYDKRKSSRGKAIIEQCEKNK